MASLRKRLKKLGRKAGKVLRAAVPVAAAAATVFGSPLAGAGVAGLGGIATGALTGGNRKKKFRQGATTLAIAGALPAAQAGANLIAGQPINTSTLGFIQGLSGPSAPPESFLDEALANPYSGVGGRGPGGSPTSMLDLIAQQQLQRAADRYGLPGDYARAALEGAGVVGSPGSGSPGVIDPNAGLQGGDGSAGGGNLLLWGGAALLLVMVLGGRKRK